MATPSDATVPTLSNSSSNTLSSSNSMSDSSGNNSLSSRNNENQGRLSDSECEPPRKRSKISIDSASVDGQISTTTSHDYLDMLPQRTCDWTDHHLFCLNISISESCTSSFEVFTNGYTNFLKDPLNEICSLSGLIEFLYGPSSDVKEAKYQCCLNAFNILSVDGSNLFESQDILLLRQLKCELEKPYNQTEFGKWMEYYVFGKDRDLKDFITNTCRGIHLRLKDFCGQLLYMIPNGKEECTEGMYQELFLLFLRIFDIKVRGYKNFPSSPPTVRVGDIEVTSVPDALIYKDSEYPSEGDKILAVVKITDVRKEHLDSNLKGQLVGDMLAALPRSVFHNNGMYGIIVQGTEVTLAALSVGKKYYENLQEGSLKEATSSVRYSKPLNFLKKCERNELIRLFVDMKAMMEKLG
ncbi:hypothetical protein FSP39_022965 [Pinctada imbricata]|uniref:Uncharacterized protein n=1 Tax=Pinctada imbricata TaxID=66713 RepID=A0AA88XE03_PINIB|nr:hypothetical protein FSP39_022965 [Pinctada imbricata]